MPAAALGRTRTAPADVYGGKKTLPAAVHVKRRVPPAAGHGEVWTSPHVVMAERGPLLLPSGGISFWLSVHGAGGLNVYESR